MLLMDCHAFDKSNARNDESSEDYLERHIFAVIARRWLKATTKQSIKSKIDCHDLTLSSLAMTNKSADCHASLAICSQNEHSEVSLVMTKKKISQTKFHPKDKKHKIKGKNPHKAPIFANISPIFPKFLAFFVLRLL